LDSFSFYKVQRKHKGRCRQFP